MTLDINYTTTNPRKVDQILETAVEAAMAATGNIVMVATNTSQGIQDAINSIVLTGQPGTVVLASADYTITTPIDLQPKVSIKGVKGTLSFAGDVPDADFTITAGTRLIVSPGVVAMRWNNVDKGAEETNIAENSLSDVDIDGIAFIGGAKAVDIGAYHAMGAVKCKFTNLYGMDQTSDYAFDFKNFQHCWFGQLYTSTQLTDGSGIRFASQLSSTLIPGNSEFGEIYTYCKNRRNKSIVFEASGPAGCILNQLKVRGRLQGNRYGAGSPDTIAFTTNGTATISVPNASVFNVGGPIVFNTTAPTNFSVGVVYFIRTLNTGGNTLTLVESPWDTVDLVAGSSGSYNASWSGWPAVMVTSTSNANSIQSSDFGQLDCEAFGNVMALFIGKTRNCVGFLAEIMTSATGTAFASRDAEISLQVNGEAVTQDQSVNWGHSSIWCAPKAYVYSGGSFTLDNSWSGRRVRYTGTSDITITVPNNIPKGFTFEITPTGATGIVTFAAQAGGAVFAQGNKLRTLGQYATARLSTIANRVCALSGDLQV